MGNAVLTDLMTADLTCDALSKFSEKSNLLPIGSEMWRLAVPLFEDIVKLTPERWTFNTGSTLHQGLGAIGGPQDLGIVRPLVLTALATIFKAIESEVPLNRTKIEQLSNKFGNQFGLSESLTRELCEFLGTWGQELQWDYIAISFTPSDGRKRHPIGLSEGQILRYQAQNDYNLFCFAPAGEVYTYKQSIVIPTDSYEFDILVLLMQRAGESWELLALQNNLARIHSVFRGEMLTHQERVNRIKNEWSTLLGKLRKRLGIQRDSIINSRETCGISSLISSFLILATDSKYF